MGFASGTSSFDIAASSHSLGTLAACGAMGHFPVCVPSNGNEVTCMARSVGGAKVEVVRVLVPEKVDEALTRA